MYPDSIAARQLAFSTSLVKLTDGQRVVRPFQRSSDGISLAIQENTHTSNASKAGHQELVISGYHSDVWVGIEVEDRRIDL